MNEKPLYCSLLKKKYDRQEELAFLIKNFPYTGCGSKFEGYTRFHIIGLILYLAGAKDVYFNVGFLSGRKDIYHLILRTTSFTVEPYLKSPVDGTNLLWFLLRKLKVPYCGGAGENTKSYMQASWIQKHGEMQDIVHAFNTLKRLKY